MNTHTWRFGLAAMATLALACQPDNRPLGPLSASRSGVPFAEGLSSPGWQETARTLVMQAKQNPVAANRTYALVSVAQYLAVQQAEAAADVGGRALLETDRGAVAGASAAVLSALFPAAMDALEQRVAAEADAGPGQPHPDFIAGEVVGRTAAAGIVARGQVDGYNTPFTGTVPVGPGLWLSSAKPPAPLVANGQLPGVTPWFLTSPGQFLPPPPPVFGSPEYLTALAEIRQLSDTRTAEQTRIALFWAQGAGTITTGGYWNVIATDIIKQHDMSEREATHVYALLNASMFDAAIGCWTAKLTYWFIRPSQADHGITLIPAIGLPNHPSYPSGHSCASSAAAEVLTGFFPDERDRLDAMVIEAGLSRMYAGIHYRFDIEAGQTLGRSVARFTIAADASGNSVLTPH